MKKTFFILALIVLLLANCCENNNNDWNYAVYNQTVNSKSFTYRPGDEMYEALIPSDLFFDKDFVKPDSIMQVGEKIQFYYLGKCKSKITDK